MRRCSRRARFNWAFSRNSRSRIRLRKVCWVLAIIPPAQVAFGPLSSDGLTLRLVLAAASKKSKEGDKSDRRLSTIAHLRDSAGILWWRTFCRSGWLFAGRERILLQDHQGGNVNIQYRGFANAETSRVYSFVVTEGAEDAREFTVKIQLTVFRNTSLKFQDGPEICSDRLKRELAGENEETRAASHLTINAGDTQEFLDRRHPRKRKPGPVGWSLAADPFGRK